MGLERYRPPRPRQLTPTLLAADVPGALVPGAVAALPASLVPDDRTDVGFLYGQLSTQVVSKTGDAMTGMLDINLPGDTGVILQLRHAGTTDHFFSTSGNAHHRGNLGVGPFADTPVQRFIVKDTNIEAWCTATGNPKSGGRGWHVNKTLATDLQSSIVSYDIEGVPKWESGIDFATDNAQKNSDFVPCFDHSAGIDDAGAGANTGADIMRISAAEQAITHGQGPKFVFGFKCGTPRANPDCFQLDAGLNLGGLRVSFNHDITKNALTLAQRKATSNRVIMAWQNANDTSALWLTGTDINAAGVSNWNFVLFDNKTTSTKKSRLFIEGTNSFGARIGFGTNAPQASHHLLFSNAAGAFDTVQSHWLASFEDTGVDGAHHNRAINIQSILDAGTVKNYVWLSGGLGTTSTTTTPTVTSTGAGAFGLERTDTELSLVYAAAGTNQTINRALRISSAGSMGFFGSAPAAKPTVTGSRGGNAALASLLTSLAGLGLITDGTSA